MPKYNFTLAFTEFAKGRELTEISHALAIPLKSLQDRARTEAWSTHATSLAKPVEGSLALKQDVEAIARNRERNLKIVHDLQTDLEDQVRKLLEGSLTTTKVTKDGVVTTEVGIDERVKLGNYARNVVDMSRSLLGDSPESKKSDAPDRTGSATAAITLVLPGQVAAPRAQRTQVFEVEEDANEEQEEQAQPSRSVAEDQRLQEPPPVVDAEIVSD